MSDNIAGELAVAVVADTTKAAKQIQALDADGEKVGSSFGKKLAIGLGGAVAAAGIGKFIGDSITAASDLSETANKISELFGPAADSVNKFAANSAKALGQSRQGALDAAAGFGVFGKSAGLTGGDLSDFSTELVTTASDMASFHNADPAAVVEALGAGLRGEAEPLRKYGILLNAAAIEEAGWAYEARTGIALDRDKKNQLTATSKVLATREAIMAQVGAAEGDFSRTSEGLANQQRILAAELENGKAALGQAFLPAALAVVKGLRPMVNTVLPALAAGLMAVEPLITAVASAGQGLVQFLIDNSAAVGVAAGIITTLMLPALLAWAVQGALTATATVVAWATSSAAAATVAAGMVVQMTRIGLYYIAMAAQAMASAVVMAAAWFIALGPIGWAIAAIVAIGVAIAVLWNKSETFRDIVTGVWEAIKGAIADVVDWMTSVAWPLIKGVWDKISAGIEVVVTVVKWYIALWLAVWVAAFNLIKAVVLAVWDWMAPYVTRALDVIKGVIDGFVKGALAVWDGLKAIATKAAAFFSDAYDKIVGWIGTIISFITSKGEAILDLMTAPYRALWGAIKGPLSEVVTKVGGFVGDVIDKVKGAASDMVGAGRSMVEGLWQGISGMGAWLAGKVRGFVQDTLPGPVKKALGINSPSRVFAGIGQNVVLGLRQGIDGERDDLLRDVGGLLPPTLSFNPSQSMAEGNRVAPSVQVFIGNDELDSYLVKVGDRTMSAAATRLLSGVGGVR